MTLKDKVYWFISKKQLFGKSYDEIMKKFYAENIEAQNHKIKINKAFLELVKDRKIIIEDNIVLNSKTTKTTNEFVGTFTQKGSSGKIDAIINGVNQEFFVPKRLTKKAPNNSLVSFSTLKKSNETIAEVKKVLKIENTIVTGFVTQIAENILFIPDDVRFSKPLPVYIKKEIKQEVLNKKVWVELGEDQFIEAKPNSIANIQSIQQIIGTLENPWTHLESYIKQKQISTEFSPEVKLELESISNVIEKEEYEKRLDLRDKMFVTIDPKTTKDMDDAVFVEKVYNEKGFLEFYDVYVAIADVSHYVKSGSATDKEAFKRGNSFYPADHVIPMFDEILSNEACSLKPNSDKLACVTKIRINRDGDIITYNFDKAIINSKFKFSYGEVSALHHNEENALEKFESFKELIDSLYEVERATTKYSKKKNRLEIKGYEPTIILNEDKTTILDIINENMVDSHKVIENIMVLNNTVVASFLNGLGVTHVLRTHDVPEFELFNSLKAQLQQLNIFVEGGLSLRTYSNILATVKDSPLQKVVSTLLVRSMQKAKYNTDKEIGHFALASKNYSHFTSPIRRYADLAEHRILFKTLDLFNEIVKEENIDTSRVNMNQLVNHISHKYSSKFKYLVNPEAVLKITAHLNDCEHKAVELERMANKVSFALHMQKQVGNIVHGYVSFIGKEGAIVTLEEKGDPKHSNIIEVLIPISEYANIVTVKKNKGKHQEVNKDLALHLGDNVEIMITKVDLLNKTVYATHNKEKFEMLSKNTTTQNTATETKLEQ